MINPDPISYGVPHREPFLFVQRVLEVRPGEAAVCLTRFSGEEDFFRGHFPGSPIVPGVIITEALAQTAGIAAGHPATGSSYRLSAIRSMKFFRAVKPGEEIKLCAEKSGGFGSLVQLQVSARVGDEVAAEGAVTLNEV